MNKRPVYKRKFINNMVQVISITATLLGIVVLAWILFTVTKMGFKALDWAFFAEPTKPYGIPDGGIANALLGTAVITAGASLIGVPLGLLGGVFLSEYARSSKLGNWIRFSANVMMGIPSIIVGLFVYSILVYTTKHYSGFAGSVALAIIMFPVVLRTTEDMLTMVPNALRESALALGTPRWKVTLGIIFRAARSGLITGVLLAIARVSGETAPLLFTALWSDCWPTSYFSQPTANLTVTITEYATNSPFEIMQLRAWGAALVITVAVLFINVFARVIFKEQSQH
jgi:phosphate transport system permease protein